MRLVSLLVSIAPERLAAFCDGLTHVPGARQHGEAAPCKRVITVEDAPGHDLMTSVLAVQGLPGVLATTLTYEYCDDEPDCLERRS